MGLTVRSFEPISYRFLTGLETVRSNNAG